MNNAGLFTGEKMKTVQGYEMQFGVNHLGHYLLTELLSDKFSHDARVINVSSGAHAAAKINFDDL
jgi:retinol dehydrogenase-14